MGEWAGAGNEQIMSGPQEDALTAPQPVVSKEDLAKGAGLAAVARLGALIEVVSQPAYTWMFGLAGYGVYVVLWAAINILANVLDLAFGQALQRIVPVQFSARGPMSWLRCCFGVRSFCRRRRVLLRRLSLPSKSLSLPL